MGRGRRAGGRAAVSVPGRGGNRGHLPMDRDASLSDAADRAPGRAHLVGLGEKGMAGLAQWLLQRGGEKRGGKVLNVRVPWLYL